MVFQGECGLPRCNRLPPRNCSHEALPFVEAAAKAKLAGSIETQPGDHPAALSAFRIDLVSAVCFLLAGMRGQTATTLRII